MPLDPAKGHAALRRGRFSQPQACYFLTLCTAARRTGLTGDNIVERVWQEIAIMEADGSWRIRCAKIMPDHVHLVIRLGERLSMSKSVQRLKAKTSGILTAASLAWERGFFDRKLRPEDGLQEVFLYVYLNPYRAGLFPRTKRWPHFRCADEDWSWFQTLLDRDLPPPEWLS